MGFSVKEKFKIDFKDGGRGRLLGFPIINISATLKSTSHLHTLNEDFEPIGLTVKG